MSRRTRVVVAIVVVLAVVVSLTVVANQRQQGRGTEVRLEAISTRDLTAIVTASGKVEAKTKVDISADITGRITRLYVREGDLVEAGQLLVQIDPAQYQSAVSRAAAFLASSEANLLQSRANMDQAKRQMDRSLAIQQTNADLIAREVVEQAQQQYEVSLATFQANRAAVDQAKASLQEANDNLAKTRLFSPIAGRVVRLAVEEGEVAVPGTFSRETGLLMTVADLSVVLAKVDVDETDVVRLSPGDSVGITIDAFPDTTFIGRVTKISNSAKLTAAAGGDQAVDFEVEVTLDNPPSDVRPDLSATARIVTDVRPDVLSIPIIALTVREHETVPNEMTGTEPAPAGTKDTKKKETEGVFVVVNGVAQFRPVRVGIAGDEYFEVLEGVQAGDTVVAGPYQAIRDLKDSTRVRPAPVTTPGAKS